MIKTITFITSGLILGLSAGIIPGPLVTLVISETLKYGPKEGIKIALAPLITDGSIILLTGSLLSTVADSKYFLGILSLMGGCYIIYLGYENFTITQVSINNTDINPNSIKKGIIANLLSPHPYIFWLTVGTPTILRGLKINLFTGASFIISFFTAMVGIKIILALMVSRSKNLLNKKWYNYTMKILGGILIVFGGLLIKKGINFL